MAKTRLLRHHRDTLRAFAREKVQIKKEYQVALDKLKAKIDKMVISWITKNFPPKDMAVLKKYDCTVLDMCINFMVPETTLAVQWQFSDDMKDSIPHMPYRASCSYRTRIHDGGTELPKLIDEYNKLKNKAEDDRRNRISDYRSLIESCRNYEDILEIWPEAKELEQRITGYALPSVVSDEMIARIKADQAERAKK
jgi:hypothetical protein